ncbi:MAG TPA: toxin-antitoxin system YwqK family antitoxin [Puia sp.]
MLKPILLLSFLCFNSEIYSQSPGKNIIMVIDSIPVINDPQPGDVLIPSDVSDITVIKNKDSLKRLGLERFDGVTYIFTRAYRSRPDSVRSIPSSNQMVNNNGKWTFRGVVYDGPFIDYYINGKKQGDGTLVNGRANGRRRIYYQNEQIMVEKIFQDGKENGLSEEFYSDGRLRQKGIYVHGKEEGIWEDYYPNGQPSLRGYYANGEVTASVYTFYSTGRIKELVFIHNGEVTRDPHLAKIESLMKKSKESSQAGDIKSAITYCNQVITLDSAFAEAYFSKATLELNDEKFDASISDFELALKYEPYMMAAFANRAFARIRKHQFSNSPELLKNSEVTVVAAKDTVEIPAEEKKKICADLAEALYLGDKAGMIYEAQTKYCQ